jgi:hypothetical protein
MATFPAGLTGHFLPTPFAYATRIAAHETYVRKQNIPDPDSTITALNPPGGRIGVNLVSVSHVPTPPPPVNHPGCVQDRMGFSFDWFEKFHVFPGSFIFGNVLSTQQVPVSVYSAYRTEEHDWIAFVNNAGQGVELLNQPAYPYTFPPQTGFAGLLLEVTPSGPPVVDTTLDFVFDEMTISPIIQLERLVLWDLSPEIPYTELLAFLTEIQTHRDGGEHRISLRKSPRQEFEWDLVLEDSITRSRIHNLLFDWHARVFGVPVWHEATFTTGIITADDLVVDVRTTSFADYREGGLALIYESSSKFDVLEVAVGGIGATDLTFTNGVQNSYGPGAIVVPLRTGVLEAILPGSRLITDAGVLRVRFRVQDNDASLASTAGWDTYNSKVILNDVNSTGGSGNSVAEEILRDIIVIDNDTGPFSIETLWAQSKRRHTKTFWVKGQADLWKVRQLLWALRGRQVSFYLPTKGQDLVPIADLLNLGTSLTVTNVGYARYVQNRQTRNIIQVVLTDGTKLVREIIGSSEVDVDSETMTVDTPWPATYTPSQVARIEYLELSRFDSDAIRFRYSLGERTCRISSPTITVFDE